jgi:hypothetical protein
VEACGGNDKACIDLKVDQMTQAALLAKSNAVTADTPVITGQRLTVNTIDANGQRKKIVIAGGQKFTLNGVSSKDPRDPSNFLPSLDDAASMALTFFITAVLTLIWVFGVVAAYSLFSQEGGNKYIGIAVAVIAILFPWTGYGFIILYFAGRAFMNEYSA